MGKNTLRLDLRGFKELMTRLDSLGGDIQKVTEDALTKAGKKIGQDTVNAIQAPNLPRGGKYSSGDTEKSVVKNPQVEWEGMTGSIGVGFDYSKPGAGGFLITGTPRMKPDAALNFMYKRKKYMTEIQDGMREVITDEIQRKMGG